MDAARKPGRFEWFFYIIFVPMLFAVLLSGVILQFLGFNIISKTTTVLRHSPVVKDMLPAESQSQSLQSSLQTKEQQNADLSAQLQKAKADQQTTQASLSALSAQNDSLQSQLNQLQQQLTQKQSDAAAVAAQVKVLTQMDAGKAAAVIGALSDAEAGKFLSAMKSDQEAAILQQMDPARAAQLLTGSSH
ncbi:MAG: hypothetical protein JWN30_1544 [Bacilli bacterium]|nr:hypothetical protein [Bacilli bacterium]